MQSDIMIDWINTQPLDSCLLVSDLGDLQSGMRVHDSGYVLCDIFNLVFNGGECGQFKALLDRQQTSCDAVANWQLLLSSMPSDARVMDVVGGRRLEEVYKVGLDSLD